MLRVHLNIESLLCLCDLLLRASEGGEQHTPADPRLRICTQHVKVSLQLCRSMNGEVDNELQRGSRGKRRRYFLAAVVRREQDARLKRLHVHSLRPLDAAHGRQQPSGSRLALPMPTFMPLAEEREQPGDGALHQNEQPALGGSVMCSTP